MSWLVSGTQITRAICALAAVGALMLAVEITTDTSQRLSQRECWRIRPQVGELRLLPAIWNVLFNGFLASVAFLTLLQTRNRGSTAMELLRLAAGVALLYALAALVFEFLGLCFRSAGYSLPTMHRAPIAARSLGEFWGQRWNIIVSAWLRTFIFWPLARRRFVGLGVLCAFLVSGALHGWPILVALGTPAAYSVVLFFVIQGVFVLAESWLNIQTWPATVARAWTLVILLATSPLVIDPDLRVFGF